MSAHNARVRVVTVSQDRLARKDRDALLDESFARMELAAARQPDIVCLPETFPGSEPEPVPGPLTERVAAWARAKGCYVICPLHTHEGGARCNTALLFDRGGAIAGRYHKIHPTEGEMERGVCPGETDPPVFETDFGPIGILICFDVNWPDAWRRLERKGARIVFWPSAFPAPRRLAALAWLNGYFVVSSTKTRASSIFDVSGEVLGASGMFRPWAEAVLPLDKRLFEIDYHVQKTRAIEKKYGRRVEIVWYHDEDWFTLASTDPELPVDEIIREFELTPLHDYLARCEAAQDRVRRPTE